MKFFKLLPLPLVLITITKCASYKLERTASFNVVSATSYSGVVGMPASPGGTQVKIVYTSEKEIQFDSIFYQHKKAKTRILDNKKEKTVAAIFYFNATIKDIQMHNDPRKEYGNTPPSKKESIPFTLKDDEIVISYIEGKKTKYYKIGNIKKGKPVIGQ